MFYLTLDNTTKNGFKNVEWVHAILMLGEVVLF